MFIPALQLWGPIPISEEAVPVTGHGKGAVFPDVALAQGLSQCRAWTDVWTSPPRHSRDLRRQLSWNGRSTVTSKQRM